MIVPHANSTQCHRFSSCSLVGICFTSMFSPPPLKLECRIMKNIVYCILNTSRLKSIIIFHTLYYRQIILWMQSFKCILIYLNIPLKNLMLFHLCHLTTGLFPKIKCILPRQLSQHIPGSRMRSWHWSSGHCSDVHNTLPSYWKEKNIYTEKYYTGMMRNAKRKSNLRNSFRHQQLMAI